MDHLTRPAHGGYPGTPRLESSSASERWLRARFEDPYTWLLRDQTVIAHDLGLYDLAQPGYPTLRDLTYHQVGEVLRSRNGAANPPPRDTLEPLYLHLSQASVDAVMGPGRYQVVAPGHYKQIEPAPAPAHPCAPGRCARPLTCSGAGKCVRAAAPMAPTTT